jgi:sugar transferase (PEP-CTERM system associated)
MNVFTQNIRARNFVLVAAESLLILAAIGLAAYIRLGEWMWEVLRSEHGFFKALLVAGVCQACLYYADLYNLREVADRREFAVRMFQALAAASFILAALYFWAPALMIGRGVFFIAAIMVVVLVFGWRIAFDWTTRRMGPRQRLLLVGTGPAVVKLARELFERRHELGLEIVGFVDPDPAKVGQPVLNPGVIGVVADIPAIVRSRAVDRVVVSLTDARGKLPMNQLLDMKLNGVTFDHLASVYEQYTGKIAVEDLRPSWLIFSSGFHGSRALRVVKRLVDASLAAVGLAVATPLMLGLAVLVRLTSSGPALYHQQRVGKDGRVFTVHKFRSMRADAEAATGAVWARPGGDSRVTPIGGFLRRARLDELPQLWNVLRGQMSLVGPRPERPEFVAELTREIPFYGQRHVVRPGLTGWAQVNYTYGATKEDALEKLQYDLFYIKNMSIALDFYVMFETIKTVILRRGA